MFNFAVSIGQGIIKYGKMKKEVDAKDLAFEWMGSSFTEKEIIDMGYRQLTAEELKDRISNKTIYGDYPMGYRFVTDIYDDGRADGINHVGSTDSGNWVIDFEEHTLALKWKNRWLDTLTHAYDVNGNIEFYDVETGNWRTTFRIFKEW